jgi:hypothetical protein
MSILLQKNLMCSKFILKVRPFPNNEPVLFYIVKYITGKMCVSEQKAIRYMADAGMYLIAFCSLTHPL